jgi:hypothetical protein
VARIGIKPTSVTDVATSKALDDLRASIPDLEVLDGARLVEGVVLTSGVQKRIAHGLGRKYRGFLPCSISAAATFIDDKTKPDRDTYLYLTSSANTTISLVVF